MQTENARLLFALLRSGVCGEPLDAPTLGALTPDSIRELYELSKAHDLAHVVGYALESAGVNCEEEIGSKFKKQQMLAIYRCERLRCELERICAVLEEEKIVHVPLKGAVMRPLYPQPWMRTSCDIDLLVREEDLDRAVSSLISRLGYTDGRVRGEHHTVLFYGSVHLELHYNIRKSIETLDGVLSRVWEYVYPEKEGGYTFFQSDEYFLFHLIAHAASHFVRGGCGIRPFMDLWVFRQKKNTGGNLPEELLEEAGLTVFAREASALSEAWFSKAEYSDMTARMERYVLSGGVYGTVENTVAIRQSARPGKMRYIAERIFPSVDTMKKIYPILEEYPALCPFCYAARWCRSLFGKNRANALYELRYSVKMSRDRIGKLGALCDDLQLHR